MGRDGRPGTVSGEVHGAAVHTGHPPSVRGPCSQGQPYPGGGLVGAVQRARAGVQHVVLDQHRDGSEDEGEEQVQVDVVPGAVQLPAGGEGGVRGGGRGRQG